MPERKGQWLYALMVIAATAVIVLSLLGIARMTGVFPRDDNAPESQRQRQSPGTGPAARSPRRLVDCARCGDAGSVQPMPGFRGHARVRSDVRIADVVGG